MATATRSDAGDRQTLNYASAYADKQFASLGSVDVTRLRTEMND